MLGMAAVGGFCAGMACALAVTHGAYRTVEGEVAATVNTATPVTVILIAADHSSRIDREIDAKTGCLGFSHVVVDAGEVDAEGCQLVYDCFPAEGVRRVRYSGRYGSCKGRQRGRVRAVLSAELGQRMRTSLASLVGVPYDPASFIAPKREGLVCSRMVLRGLPSELQAKILPWDTKYPVSPNDLARAWGISSPDARDVMVTP